MVDIKQVKVGDYLSDKYGRVFVVYQKSKIHNVLSVVVKEVYQDEEVEQPILHMIHPYYGLVVYSTAKFQFNQYRYYAAYQDEESALEGCAVKGDELQEDIKGKYILYLDDLELFKPESLDVVLFDMFKEADFDDESRSKFIKRLKLIRDDGEPRSSAGFVDELIRALKLAKG